MAAMAHFGAVIGLCAFFEFLVSLAEPELFVEHRADSMNL